MHLKLEHHFEHKEHDVTKFIDIINPRIPTLLIIIFILFVVSSSNISLPKFFLYLWFLFIFVFLTHQNVKIFVYSITYALPFMFLIFVMFLPYLINTKCVDTIRFMWLCFDRNVLARLAQTFAKIFLSMSCVISYVYSLNKSKIIESLHWLGLPAVVIKIISITLIYLEMLKQKFTKVRIAINMKLFSKPSYVKYWKILGYAFAYIFLHSYKKIFNLYYSLKLRGYDTNFKNFAAYNSSLTFADFAFFFIMTTILFLIKMVNFVYFN